MIETTAANMAKNFNEFLAKVEGGEIIRISDQGRTVARLSPEFDFMSGQKAAELFRGHKADGEAANAIANELRELDLSSEDALDH
jgi:antitoxin (DNA-binding transcriptional repressor) of toxin-antitoxin stability system